MITPEQKAAIKNMIQQSRTSQYMAGYLACLGANMDLGEKKARKLAREAGRCAMVNADNDLAADHEAFAAACQESYDEAMLAIAGGIEKPKPSLLVPERFANGNGTANGSLNP